jgi:hypothetical protein
MSIPINIKLYEKVKLLANKKFKSNSGIYRSSWIVKEYKKRGGKYKGKKNKSGLTRWYKEKWVNLNKRDKNGKYTACGRKSSTTSKYPLCRPTKRINSKTPRTIYEISKKSISKAKKDKSKVKHLNNIKFGKGQDNNTSTNLGLFTLLILGLINFL